MSDMNMLTHIVCPFCNGTNRVPTDKMNAELSCGKCHQPLFNQHPSALDGAGLKRQIDFSDVPVVVDFWAPWCGPCRMMAPEYEKACAQLEPRARCIKVDTEAHQDVATQYQIRSIPTLAIFKGGREVARMSGARSARDLVQWVQPYL
jgi:thioredoxin 2